MNNCNCHYWLIFLVLSMPCCHQQHRWEDAFCVKITAIIVYPRHIGMCIPVRYYWKMSKSISFFIAVLFALFNYFFLWKTFLFLFYARINYSRQTSSKFSIFFRNFFISLFRIVLVVEKAWQQNEGSSQSIVEVFVVILLLVQKEKWMERFFFFLKLCITYYEIQYNMLLYKYIIVMDDIWHMTYDKKKIWITLHIFTCHQWTLSNLLYDPFHLLPASFPFCFVFHYLFVKEGTQ